MTRRTSAVVSSIGVPPMVVIRPLTRTCALMYPVRSVGALKVATQIRAESPDRGETKKPICGETPIWPLASASWTPRR